MLTVWGRPSAYNVQKVRWFITELGLEYEHIDIGGAIGGLENEAFLMMNPHGRIPVIKDGEYIVWESNSILRYLAATYAINEYWNESPAERSLIERWMDWELSTLQPLFLELFWGHYRTPEAQRDQSLIEHYRQACEQRIKVLDAVLEKNEYVAGESFSLADVCVGTCFFRYFNMGIDVDRPVNVDRWYLRLAERPAYQQIIQAPFEDLKGRLTF